MSLNIKLTVSALVILGLIFLFFIAPDSIEKQPLNTIEHPVALTEASSSLSHNSPLPSSAAITSATKPKPPKANEKNHPSSQSSDVNTTTLPPELLRKNPDESNNKFLVRMLRHFRFQREYIIDNLLQELRAQRLAPNEPLRERSPHYTAMYTAMTLSKNHLPKEQAHPFTVEVAKAFTDLGELPQNSWAWKQSIARLSPEVNDYFATQGVEFNNLANDAYRAGNFALLDYLSEKGDQLQYSEELYQYTLNGFKWETVKNTASNRFLLKLRYLGEQDYIDAATLEKDIQYIQDNQEIIKKELEEKMERRTGKKTKKEESKASP